MKTAYFYNKNVHLAKAFLATIEEECPFSLEKFTYLHYEDGEKMIRQQQFDTRNYDTSFDLGSEFSEAVDHFLDQQEKTNKDKPYEIGDFIFRKRDNDVREVVGFGNNGWLALRGEMSTFGGFDHHNPEPQHIRYATESEVQEYLIEQAKEQYDPPCVIRYLDRGLGRLQGFALHYDADTKRLFASDVGFESHDVVWEKGEWAKYYNPTDEFLEELKFFRGATVNEVLNRFNA